MQQATTAPRDADVLVPLDRNDERPIADEEQSQRSPNGRDGSTGQAEQPLPRAIRSVLVPTDFSSASAAALDRAVEVANKYHAALTILHVIDVNTQPPPAESGKPGEFMMRLWKEGTAQIGRSASSLSGELRADISLQEGLPWEEIVEASRKHDLLVLGQARSSKWWRLFSHRTAQRVLENAACPVMLVRGENGR